jgi:hypothetical protein
MIQLLLNFKNWLQPKSTSISKANKRSIPERSKRFINVDKNPASLFVKNQYKKRES